MSASPYHSVRGLERGLAVLGAVNALGQASTVDVAAVTGLPRPTVHRLLETLRLQGYLCRASLRDAYRLTIKVKTLSGGYKDGDGITGIADAVLADLFKAVVWPTDIATFDDDAMVIRATTHGHSPLSIERSWVGRRLPVVGTAVGQAYLAFSPPERRRLILERLAAPDSCARSQLPPAATLRRELAATRRRGYGVRQRGVMARTSSIAVPILHQGDVLGGINIIWIDSALSLEDATRRYLPLLRQAAARVESAYAAMLRGEGETSH